MLLLNFYNCNSTFGTLWLENGCKNIDIYRGFIEIFILFGTLRRPTHYIKGAYKDEQIHFSTTSGMNYAKTGSGSFSPLVVRGGGGDKTTSKLVSWERSSFLV